MGDVLAVRDEFRAQNWAMLIQECNASGLTNKEFCRRRGVSEKSYYYWLRKLRSQAAASAPQIAALDSVERTEGILEIRYRGAALQLPGNIDIEAVADKLRRKPQKNAGIT